MTQIKVENTKWNPPDKVGRHGHNSSDSRVVLDTLLPGDCVRITHTDLSCNWEDGTGSCSLCAVVNLKKRGGWDLEIYHEKRFVAVVRRN
jgi:hypothetical protein